MSPEEYATMPVERLLRLFAETAKRSGVGRVFQVGGGVSDASLPTKEETKLGFAEAAAIAAALRYKAKESELEPLFDSDDPDVRMCAAAFLEDLFPVSAEAAWRGVLAKCSTREALKRGRRARTPPPPRPMLQEMSDDALLERFQDAAERQTACRFTNWLKDDKDEARRNAIIGELTDILREMKRRDMLARLLPFLDSTDPTARSRAAQGCLRIAPEKAVATLEAIVEKEDTFARAAALDALDHWRNGYCLVDKL
jgi:HEAT repeat protein